jgi:hypothetical protein
VFLAARAERTAILSDGDALVLRTTRATTHEFDRRHDRMQVNASFGQGGNMHEAASSICGFGRHPPKADNSCVIAAFAAHMDARLPRVAALQNAYR